MFEQTVAEYKAEFHDTNFRRPAERTQLLLKLNGEAIGVLTLDCFQEKSAATRCVAIREDHQGRGHGRVMASLTRAFAKSSGCTTLCVNAGPDAEGFYRTLGFERQVWDEHEFEGIPNPTMIQMVCRI